MVAGLTWGTGGCFGYRQHIACEVDFRYQAYFRHRSVIISTAIPLDESNQTYVLSMQGAAKSPPKLGPV